MSSIVEALNLLQKHKWIDLTHGVSPEIPRFGAFPKLEIETPYNVKEHGFFVNKVSFVTQYGTHIDAPVHFNEQNRTLDKLELKEFILPLIVINKEDEVQQNPDFILQAEHILEWEEKHGAIPQDSFVAFASGWSKRWGKQDFSNKDSKGEAHSPGWSIQALDLVLNKRGAKAVGHETFDTDASSDALKNGAFLSEKFVLDCDKYQIELMNNLTLLPPTGSIIIVGVPKFLGLPGFPVRAFAIVPN